MIPDDILEKFRAYYKSDFNIELTDEEALAECSALFTFLEQNCNAVSSLTMPFKKLNYDQ